jgi:hypothetical protein
MIKHGEIIEKITFISTFILPKSTINFWGQFLLAYHRIVYPSSVITQECSSFFVFALVFYFHISKSTFFLALILSIFTTHWILWLKIFILIIHSYRTYNIWEMNFSNLQHAYISFLLFSIYFVSEMRWIFFLCCFLFQLISIKFYLFCSLFLLLFWLGSNLLWIHCSIPC